jgi:hypothetical protein
MNVTWKTARENWHIGCALVALVTAAVAGDFTLKQHSQQLDEIKATASKTSEKVDARFDAMNSKLDKISDNTSYVRGKVDEMDRRAEIPSKSPVAAAPTE